MPRRAARERARALQQAAEAKRRETETKALARFAGLHGLQFSICFPDLAPARQTPPKRTALPSPDTTTAPPSTATTPGSPRRFRQTCGNAPPERDSAVNRSRPHPREAVEFTKKYFTRVATSAHLRIGQFCGRRALALRKPGRSGSAAPDEREFEHPCTAVSTAS